MRHVDLATARIIDRISGSFDTKNLVRISFSSIFTGNSPDEQRRGLNAVSTDLAVCLELSQCL